MTDIYSRSTNDLPWSCQGSWQEMAGSLSFLMEQYKSGLHHARDCARDINEQIVGLSPIMDRLCRQTCPSCLDICCSRATVWYDFKDLLYLALLGRTFPPCQINKDKSGFCCCLGPEGCRLDRAHRPFICTWYLCPDQRVLLDRTAIVQMDKTILEMKRLRQEMESIFIRVSAGGS